MPISLGALKNEERTFTFNYQGETAEITYRVHGYTPFLERKAQESLQEQLPARSIAIALAELLIAWDVVGENGQVLDVSYDTLEQFPFEFLTAVMNAITEDQQVGREDRKNLGAGSRRRAKSANAQTGIH